MAETPLRIAIVSTPRSGNTWVRMLVAGAYRLPPHTAAHELSDADWLALPPECALQIHWRREPSFVAKLHEQGFRVLTLARHPLDVLISILQFAVHNPETARWLCGRGGDESGIWGAMPPSRPFVEYATGPRAAELLAVTCDWWGQPGVVGMRYEDFVADPAKQLVRLSELFGPLREDPAEVVARHTIGKLRRDHGVGHCWQGRPGLWRVLLPAAEAHEIAAAVAPVFDILGYTFDPDPHLDAATADRNWVRLTGPELRAAIDRSAAAYIAQIDSFRATADAARREAEELRAEVDRLRARLAELDALPARMAG